MHVRLRGARITLAVASLVLPAAGAAGAQDKAPSATEDVSALRQELEALRREYADRIAALEERLRAIEGAPAAEPQTPSPTAAVEPPPAPPASPEPPAAPPPGSGSKFFNPDIAAIGNFVGVAGPTPGSGEPSLNMQEAEISFQAVVDPFARADFFVTLGPDEVGLEEGFITFPTLPLGLLAKVGKMRDAFGRVNPQHPHTLPWIDRPLVTTNLTGGDEGLADSGLSVARLIPVPGLFLEATGQVYQGNSSIFAAPTRGDLAWVGHLRGYRDLGESTNLDLGGSIAYGHNGVTPDATTRLLGVDATLRWKPLRRSIYTSLLARGEAVWSRREDEAAAREAFGAYGFLEYQFARRFSAGARFDYAERADAPGVRDKGGSLVLTFKPSEWSYLRAQYRRTTYGDESPVNELLFQLLFAIGAHGAHPF
jgi:hypothetical protein